MFGKAAIAMWWEIASEVKSEFEDWHSHEHMPERLAIPGFLRGSRWVSVDGSNSYFILYETESLDTVTSGPYLERLNNPTPWSRKIMPQHRNMVRSLCRVQSTFGSGLAEAMLTVRFSPKPRTEERLGQWLAVELLRTLPARKGLVAAHLLRDAARSQGAPTTEQKIRGSDTVADWIVLVNGYDANAVRTLAIEELNDAAMAAHGAVPGSIARVYSLAYLLTAADIVKPNSKS